jgi:hypothetical protein
MHKLIGYIIEREDIDDLENPEINDEEIINMDFDELSEEYEVEPYIKEVKSDIIEDFKEHSTTKIKDFDKDYEKVKKWASEWYGGKDFDDDGNLLSTWNENSVYDWFQIGGRWNGIWTEEDSGKNLIKVSELIKMFKKQEEILNDKEKLGQLKLLANTNGEEFYEWNPYFVMLCKGNEILFSKEELSKEELDALKEAKKEYLKILEENKDCWICAIDIHY